MSGLITGKGNGNWGRVTVKTDGSILLENVNLSNIAIRNCDLVAESGEYPIPFADRMNQLEDFASGGEAHPDTKLDAGHTHSGFAPDDRCVLCGTTEDERQADNDAKDEALRFLAEATDECECVVDPDDGSTIQAYEKHPLGGSPKGKAIRDLAQMVGQGDDNADNDAYEQQKEILREKVNKETAL